MNERRNVTTSSKCILAFVLTMSACSINDADITGVVQPSELRSPAGAAAMFSGALTAFAGAYNGLGTGVGGTGTGIGAGNGNASAVAVSGLASDELGAAGIGSGEIATDQRALAEANQVLLPMELYASLSQARVNAIAAAQVMEAVSPAARARIGEMFAVAAYSELNLGELYCAGITLTTVSDGLPSTYGTPLTITDVLTRSSADFDSATTYGKDSAVVLNLARIGKARTLLDLGQFAAAASAVSAVPTSFVFVTEHSAAIQPNRLSTGFTTAIYTVSDREGVNGLDFRSSGDPRVKSAFLRKGADATTDVYGLTTLIQGQSTPTVLANGIEARLIESEAALQANPNDATTSGSGWLGILNTLRATAISPALPPLADPGNFSARVDLLFRERAFWLYATGHRFGDLRRLVRQYGRSQSGVFPTGTYRSGTPYGTDVTMAPSPVTEGRNPNYRGCLNRDP